MNYLSIFKKRWKLVVLFVIVSLMISLGLSLAQPFQYEAVTRSLVIQKESGDWDALSAARAAERLSIALADVIYTNSFFNKVLDSGFNVIDDFGTDPEKRLQKWQRDIKTSVSQETGIITVKAYDNDRQQANLIVSAISYVLETDGKEYHGGGQNVVIKTVDAPMVSSSPKRPNLPLNLGMAFGLGLLAGLAFIFLSYREKKETH
ncbi:MAG: Wzz/FepE/Etk N-terminal domain-containing protein [Patescibacteria group bacterium]